MPRALALTRSVTQEAVDPSIWGPRSALLTYLLTTHLPKRRVRDGAGPLRALSRVRSCADACCSLLVRRRGSIAPASAWSRKVHLSRLQHGLHNLPHSSKHVDVLELMLGCSRLDGQLPSGLSAWPAPLGSDGTSSRVAGVARRVGSMGVSMGKVPRCHGGPVARWSWWERVCDAGTMRVGGGTGRSSPSVAFLRHWAADHWSNGSTGFWRQFGSSAQDDEHIGAGARRGARLRDLAYGVSKLFSQPCVRLVALRVLWTARAARRPFLFWIGRRARSGCAGPPGPRPLAPPRMRPSESGWDDDDSTGHRGGELRR